MLVKKLGVNAILPMLCRLRFSKSFQSDNEHLLDIPFIASGQGNIGRSEAEPNIILYGSNQLDVG